MRGIVGGFPYSFPLEFTSDTLKSAQESASRKPAPKLVLTLGENTYTYERDRIIRIEHVETETSHATKVVLSNADGSLTDIDFKGYSAVLYHGLIGKVGAEYSACAPLTVLGQKFESYPGGLICALQLVGIPDRLREDKASADYEHHWSSTKTVKDLITEILDGNPVTEELTERQDNSSTYEILEGSTLVGAGQKKTIDKTITKLSFKLKKTGNPTGNITFHITDVDTEASLGSKVLGDASILTTSGVWYEVTFDTPVVVDQEVYLWCEFSGGDGANYVEVADYAGDLKVNENYINIAPAGSPYIFNFYDYECAYRYKYNSSGISVYDHCAAYEVDYDSEDSLIDTYCPADSFSIKYGEDRLAVIDKLLFHTNCQRIFKDDGKIHIFEPTTTGTDYYSEYSLESGHTFFSKSLRKGLVLPNRVVVESNKYDESQFSGSATSAASYALLPISDFYRTMLESDDQADDIAAAIISRLEIAAQQGGATVPINCGAELYDYINVIDSRESDSRAGNIGSLSIIYQAERGNQPARYDMNFGFGRVTIKGVAGTRISSLSKTRFITKALDNSIPWDELYELLKDIVDNLHEHNVALGWVEGETPTDDLIDDALLGYLKHIVEDTAPELGDDLDASAHEITNLKKLSIYKEGVLIGWLIADDDDNLYLKSNTGKELVLSAGSEALYLIGGLIRYFDADGLHLATAGTDRIVDLADPTSDQDAATKKYVDDHAGTGDMTKAVYDPDDDGKVTPEEHSHAATEITSGTLDGDRLPGMSATKKGGVPATGTPSGKYLKDNGAFDTPPGGLANVVEDTTPQLGGDLDTNGHKIVTVSGDLELESVEDISLTPAALYATKITRGQLMTNMNASGFKIHDHLDPTSDQDVATKKYVDDNSGGLDNVVEDTSPQLGGSLDANGNMIDMDSQRIVSLGSPSTGTDAVNRDYVTGKLDDISLSQPANALGTIYQNTSTKIRYVTVIFRVTGAGQDDDIELQIGSSSPPDKIIDHKYVVYTYNGYNCVKGFVPPNYYYRAVSVGSGDATLYEWNEFDLF